MTTQLSSDSRSTGRAAFATTGPVFYPLIAAVFCSLLLLSNIGATKGIQFGPVLTDGGVFLFPLTYVLGDVMTEVYGVRAARKVIVLGFGIQVLATLTFWLVSISPGAPGYTGQDAFDAIFGVQVRLVIAGASGYLLGEFLNSYVLVKIKERTREHRLWLRLVTSTLVAEFFDTLAFCLIAGPVIGITGFSQLANYTILGFVIKVGVEIILLPVTYRVIAAIKKREPSYAEALAAQRW